jgi:16S rRNA (adenine1518-N6/adenine1519-N6)-dimethyltransferase
VRLRVRPRSAADVADETLLWQLVSAGFAQRRKTIYNNLRSAPAALAERINEHGGANAVLAAAELDSQRRAETLTLAEWSRLTRALENKDEK